MSIESAKSFVTKMETDKDFMKSVIRATTPDERKGVVTAAGFDFTFAELQAATADAGVDASKISEEDLDKIAAACIGIAAVTAAGAVGGATAGSIVSAKAT